MQKEISCFLIIRYWFCEGIHLLPLSTIKSKGFASVANVSNKLCLYSPYSTIKCKEGTLFPSSLPLSKAKEAPGSRQTGYLWLHGYSWMKDKFFSSLLIPQRVVLLKKAQARIWKTFFSNFKICHNQFFCLKTQYIGAWKLQCAQLLRNQF